MKSTPTLRFTIKRVFRFTRISCAALAAFNERRKKQSFPHHSDRSIRVFNACALAFFLLTMPLTPFAAPTKGSAAQPNITGERLNPLPSQPSSKVDQNAPTAATVTATLADDIGLGAKKSPGATITYTATISDAGTDATGVTYTDNLNSNVTQVGTVNVSPVTVDDTFPVTVIGNVSINSSSLPVPYSVFGNDYQGQNGGALTITAFDATTTNGGQIVMTTSGVGMGEFTYNPPAGFEGTDTFHYTLANSVGSSIGTVSIPVSGMVWFINNGAAACATLPTCGRLSNPFSTLAAFNSANGQADVPATHTFNPAANDNIFIYESSTQYTGAVTLLSGQKLIGQDATASLSTITGLTPTTPAMPAFPVMNSGNATVTNLGNTVTLNTNATVRGLQINSTSNTGLNDPAGAITGVNVSEVIVNTTTGTAVLLSSTSGTLSFTSVSANGGSKGISVSNLTGSFTSNGGTIQGTTNRGAEFITTSNGASNSVILSGMTFTNATTADGADPTVQSGGCGVAHSGGNNQSCNAPIFFDGVSRASLSSITVSGSTQMGVNINASNDLTMNAVNVSGAGNNPNEFGVNIHNLTGTNNWSGINIHDNPGANHQVYVEANSTSSTGTFNITGSSQFTCALSGGVTRVGGNLLSFDGYGSSANMAVTVTGATFSGGSATALLFHTQQTSGNSSLDVGTSSFTNNNSQIDISKINGATVTYNVHDNATMTGANFGEAINVASGNPSSGTMSGTISNNVIGNAGVAGSGCTGGCGGIFLTTISNSTITANITGNFIHQVSSNAINATAGQIATGNTNTINVNITGNTIDTPFYTAGSGTFNAIFIESGTSSTQAAAVVCATIGDVTGTDATKKNTITGNWGPNQFDPFDAPILLRQRFAIDVFRLAGWTASGTTSTSHDASAEAFVNSHNTITANGLGHTTSATVGPAAMTGGAPTSCPLLLAEGGVIAALNAPSLLSNFALSWVSNSDSGANGAGRSNLTAPSSVTTSLEQQQLDSAVNAAIQRWAATGLTAQQVATLCGIRFEIADLQGAYLGEADGNRIEVDRNAEGKGWFVDADPMSDSSFAHPASTTRLYTDPMNAAAGHVDLLTAIEHEMGHRLGLDDSYAEKDRDSIMYGYLTVGERRVPTPGQAQCAKVSNQTKPHFLSLRSAPAVRLPNSDKRLAPLSVNTVGPISIGTLNPGKSVTIVYQATVNTPPLVRQVSTQGTVSGSNFSNVLTDDPEIGGSSDPTLTNINTTSTWTGNTSTNWSVITNWSPNTYAPGIANPGVNDVVIPFLVPNDPTLSANADVFSLTMNNTGASTHTLTIAGGITLTIDGAAAGSDLTFTGTIPNVIAGGALNFGGAGPHVINNTSTLGSLSPTNAATVLSGASVTLSPNNMNMGTLAVNSTGTMNISNRTLGLQGAGAALTVPAGATFTTTGSTVQFQGGAPQTTDAPSFANLNIFNGTGVTLTANASCSGILNLFSGDLNTGAFVLTQPGTTLSQGTFDVVGTVKRTGSPNLSGAPLTFGNPNNRITFLGGTTPTDMSVTLAKTAPATYATAVLRTYTVATTGGSGSTGTFRLRYIDPGDLNGNSEPALNLRRLRTGDSHWVAQLPDAVDTTNNFVEATSVPAANLPTQWTFSSFAPTASGGMVTGRIVDNNGNPVEGTVVRLAGTQNRKFITDANGFYRFENVETSGFYTVTPSRANYEFSPDVRSFSQLGETTNAAFSASMTSGGFVNPLDTPEYFVRQNYLDFLGREPDEAGFNFWSDQILGCGNDTNCISLKREYVSAAYFRSIEFQKTGGLVDGLYRASYGTRPDFAQFMPDTRTVGQGVIVNMEGWEARLNANKEAFINAFVNRAAFHAMYDGLSSSDFVDALISHTGVSFTSGERDALVSGLGTGTMSRAEALRSIAENNHFVDAKQNDAFVMMEYFGYLRRDPDAGGFGFWLDKLNHFGGNFEQAEMVKAFIISGEYRDRFPR